MVSNNNSHYSDDIPMWFKKFDDKYNQTCDAIQEFTVNGFNHLECVQSFAVKNFKLILHTGIHIVCNTYTNLGL